MLFLFLFSIWLISKLSTDKNINSSSGVCEQKSTIDALEEDNFTSKKLSTVSRFNNNTSVKLYISNVMEIMYLKYVRVQKFQSIGNDPSYASFLFFFFLHPESIVIMSLYIGFTLLNLDLPFNGRPTTVYIQGSKCCYDQFRLFSSANGFCSRGCYGGFH
jgi:hypothetical protein